MSQTEIARRVHGISPETDSDIGRQALLDDALACAGCFSHWSPGRPTFERISQELSLGRPICVCVEWKEGGAHYILVSGAFQSSREIYIQDPEVGSSIQNFEAFPTRYRQGGWWRGVYWTAQTHDDNGCAASKQ